MRLRLPAHDPVLEGPNVDATTSALVNTGLSLLALDGDAAQAERFFRGALRFQDMDRRSARYGDVPFRIGRPEAIDTNAIEFTMWSLGSAIAAYGTRLSPKFRDDVSPHLRAAIEAIQRHGPPINYTNIWLMKAANLITLGHLIDDHSAVADGEAAFDRWLDFTRTNGVSEYDSPTYSATQIACLLTIFRDAAGGKTRAKVRAALDYLWSDLAVNYFAGARSISGPFSRTHDFLYQREPVTYFYYLEGFAPDLAGKDELGGLWLTAAAVPYQPPPSTRDLVKLLPRIVQQRVGLGLAGNRYNYVTPDFAIGSASGSRGGQDLTVCVKLASSKELPAISVLSDDQDAPYGSADGRANGSHKVQHLQQTWTAVQDKGVVLALMDVAPGLVNHDSTVVTTNIILPVNADAIFLNGKELRLDRPFDQPADDQSTVVVREGDAAVAVRIFAADGCETNASFSLKYDGNQEHAGRLVAYHYRGEPKRLGSTPVRAAVVICAEKCETDKAFSDFISRAAHWKTAEERKGDQWSASASVGETRLEAAIDLRTKQCLSRRVNGRDAVGERLSVNGKDIAAAILDTVR